MTAVDEMRSQLRASRRKPAPPPWTPPRASDFEPARAVLAFDATLSHTGWLLMDAMDGRIVVIDKGIINPATTKVSYLATWEKAHELRGALKGVFFRALSVPHTTAVEAPSVGGGNRTESSLIAGLMISLEDPECVTVSATHISKVLLGDARIRSEDRKKAIREAVIRLIPEAAGRGWNEHIRDAASVALTHMHDEKRLRALEGKL